MLQMLKDGICYCNKISLTECDYDGNWLTLYSWLYVPEYNDLCLYLIRSHYDIPAAEHPSWAKTLELLCRTYYWPKMHYDVECFIHNCHVCQ